MIHARDDYNRIQDPENLIGEDEPVFLIRGKDIAGPQTIRDWAQRAKLFGAKDDIIQKALDHAVKMEEWQRVNVAKVPDL